MKAEPASYSSFRFPKTTVNLLLPMKWLNLLLVFLVSGAMAQEPLLRPVQGVPSNEVYDLLRDSSGFVWLAHNAGLSRYDGHNFVHYGNPQQNSRAVTDLCQDAQGRIWCHNFEGQIFYAEGRQLHLLRDYDFRQERF
ncbi:MAG: hypothetical protein EOO11_19880, partial [Chitinophagaceae bacterium]